LILAVHQPQYLPWLGYFDKIRRADVFCFLDNVQFKKNEWQNRNRIKTAHGWQWLTVPVSFRFPQKINEVTIAAGNAWRRKHLQALITNYSGAPYFDRYIDRFREVYESECRYLSDLNIELIECIGRMLPLNAKQTVRASGLKTRDEPTDRLIDICRAAGADTYLAGAGGAGYMDLQRFADAGIRLIFQAFNHPVYHQRFGDFVANLSVVDLLFNCGPGSLAKIVESNRATL
jgi:hypothetical protein